MKLINNKMMVLKLQDGVRKQDLKKWAILEARMELYKVPYITSTDEFRCGKYLVCWSDSSKDWGIWNNKGNPWIKVCRSKRTRDIVNFLLDKNNT